MENTNAKRVLRHIRLRRRVSGNLERPRLSFFRSLHFIYAQVIDDSKGTTLLAGSTKDASFKTMNKLSSFKNKEAAKLLGEVIGKMIVKKGIKQIVFDRGGFQYHGVVKEFADAVRKEGVNF
ncbi:MAG: 50S ribosomal protein L18 [Caldisericia bacterium]|nr:50S ribosomal protein L18 [Caldisericia bacterium]